MGSLFFYPCVMTDVPIRTFYFGSVKERSLLRKQMEQFTAQSMRTPTTLHLHFSAHCRAIQLIYSRIPDAQCNTYLSTTNCMKLLLISFLTSARAKKSTAVEADTTHRKYRIRFRNFMPFGSESNGHFNHFNPFICPMANAEYEIR